MVQAKRVPDDIIVIRVSARKWRLASATKRGEGFSHFNREPWGLTNIREYEYLTEPLDYHQMHQALADRAVGEPPDYQFTR